MRSGRPGVDERAGLLPRQHRVRDGEIGDRRRQGAVLRHPRPAVGTDLGRDDAAPRLQRDQPAGRRRQPERAHAVVAVRERHRAGGDGRGAAPGAARRRPGGVPGVAAHGSGTVRGGVEAQLGSPRDADHDRAGLAQPRDHRVVLRLGPVRCRRENRRCRPPRRRPRCPSPRSGTPASGRANRVSAVSIACASASAISRRTTRNAPTRASTASRWARWARTTSTAVTSPERTSRAISVAGRPTVAGGGLTAEQLGSSASVHARTVTASADTFDRSPG